MKTNLRHLGNSGSLRIALTADPELPVPPIHYGGIERIVDMLARGLVARGHEVTVFAHPEFCDWRLPHTVAREGKSVRARQLSECGHVSPLCPNRALRSRAFFFARWVPRPDPAAGGSETYDLSARDQPTVGPSRPGSVARHAVVLRDQSLDDAKRG